MTAADRYLHDLPRRRIDTSLERRLEEVVALTERLARLSHPCEQEETRRALLLTATLEDAVAFPDIATIRESNADLDRRMDDTFAH